MQDAAESSEVAYTVRRAFVGHFQLYLDGRQTKHATKQAVANLVIDEEPTMMDDFMQVYSLRLIACFTTLECIMLQAVWFVCAALTSRSSDAMFRLYCDTIVPESSLCRIASEKTLFSRVHMP
jgi:hypothetical protein